MTLNNDGLFSDPLESEYQRQIADKYQRAVAERERVNQYKPVFDLLVKSIMKELPGGLFDSKMQIAQRSAANFLRDAFDIDASIWFQYYL
jgi:hypothetical protein